MKNVYLMWFAYNSLYRYMLFGILILMKVSNQCMIKYSFHPKDYPVEDLASCVFV
jgi:hypothetical protein